MTAFTESVVEEAALAWLRGLGYAVLHGPGIAAGMPAAERSDPTYRDVVLESSLRQALARLNTELPADAHEDGGVSPCGRFHRRRAGAGARLRQTCQQRLAGCQPVHRVTVSVQQSHGAATRCTTGICGRLQRIGRLRLQVYAFLGVSVRTLQEWEQGRRAPSGAARTLLLIAQRNPRVLLDVA